MTADMSTWEFAGEKRFVQLTSNKVLGDCKDGAVIATPSTYLLVVTRALLTTNAKYGFNRESGNNESWMGEPSTQRSYIWHLRVHNEVGVKFCALGAKLYLSILSSSRDTFQIQPVFDRRPLCSGNYIHRRTKISLELHASVVLEPKPHWSVCKWLDHWIML